MGHARRTGWMAGAILLLLAALPARAEEPIPVFDAHLHYNWEPDPRLSRDEVSALFQRAGVRGILANSRPNDGTRALHDARSSALAVVPSLRPYRTRSDVGTWFDDPGIPPFVEREFAHGIYRGLGEFHVFGQQAATPVTRRLVAFAEGHGLFLFAHCDEEALHLLFSHAPGIRVLWAHSGFDVPVPAVRALLERYPNLRAELSYRGGITDAQGRLTGEWRALFEQHPDRFVLGSDTWVDGRWDDYEHILADYRHWLAQLPRPVAEAIAYRNAESWLGVRR